MKVGVWAAGLLLVGGWAQAAKPVEILPRTGKWVVDYADNACNLIATFGAGDERVIVRLTRLEPDGAFDVALVGPRFRSQGLVVKAATRFEPGGQEMETEALHGTAGGLPMLSLGGRRLDGATRSAQDGVQATLPVDQGFEDRIDRLSVRFKGRDVVLALGPMALPLAAVRACTDDLVRGWGFDPAEQKSLSHEVTPVASPGQWLNNDDYPTSALRRGASARVSVRLDIDAAGSITGCHVLTRTAGDEFPKATCDILKRRGRFEPAVNATGDKVASFYIMRFVWRIG